MISMTKAGTRQLTADDLYSLEHYSNIRSSFRSSAIESKSRRRVELGDHVVVCFENKLTVQYQVQEILRAARIFERERIEEELEAYRPLLPGGGNLKASMMLQTDNKDDLADIGNCVWLQCGHGPKIYASSDYKVTGLAAMQWLVFELDDASQRLFKTMYKGAHDLADTENSNVKIGVENPLCQVERCLPQRVCESIAEDI